MTDYSQATDEQLQDMIENGSFTQAMAAHDELDRREARSLALAGERFDTTEDLAGALGIDPGDDDAIAKMWRAAHAYHDAGGRFSPDEENDYFDHHDW